MMTQPSTSILPRRLPRSGLLEANDRVMVVAAHPDDETFGAGGLLCAARDPWVVCVTDGTPRDERFFASSFGGGAEAYAQTRRAELDCAMTIAGLSPDRVARLGFVDREVATRIAPLCHALTELIRERGPTLIVTHAYEGGHPDHDATAVAVALAIRAFPWIKRFEMLGYHGLGGPWQIGAFLPSNLAEEIVFELEPRLAAQKRAMLAAYASQAETLGRFSVCAERFRDAVRHDFCERPHAGPLHYEQLGWGSFDDFASHVENAVRELTAR